MLVPFWSHCTYSNPYYSQCIPGSGGTTVVPTTTSIPATGRIWLRVAADIRPGSTGSKQGLFSYSTNGSTFTRLGGAFSLNTEWQFFMGYRFGILNYATSSLGGSVTVSSFMISAS
ncbi:hypothetical protein BJ165DRAFT_1496332 [Panaeolus papilionaceus]|nr:hypothetical protein BJ165DRAFT_1496332 [Panaeolus papilionaceus]